MKHFLTIFALFFVQYFTVAQQDTTIYTTTDIPALTVNCKNVVEKDRMACSNESIMSIITKNVKYPEKAHEQKIEGKVVTQFVVEKDGNISNVKVLKGQELLNKAVLDLFEEMKKEVLFVPASINGKTVRYQMVLPVKFKIKEEAPVLPYEILENDTIYTAPTRPVSFKGGEPGLQKYLKEKTPKIKALNDSCSIGIIQYAVSVLANNGIKVIDTYDFSQLGLDAQFEGIKLIKESSEKWIPAEFNGKKVSGLQTIRIRFQPDAKKCATNIKNFDLGYKLSDEALKAVDAKQNEKAFELFNQSVKLMPKNTEVRYQRGLVEVNMSKNAEACEDLQYVKKKLKVNWADSLLKFVCFKK